jgi:hypothetical protein
MHRGGPELVGSGSPWPSEAQRLLLEAAVGPAEGVLGAFNSWRAMTDIEAPVDGGTYRLLPLLYARLSALHIDDPLMGRLKGIYRRAWYQNNLLFHRVVPAVAALELAGIRTMLLKGAPIALTYHASHATRPMADLDLLVKADQADAARMVLAELGWKATTKHPQHELLDIHAQDLRNADGTEIDLHWHCLREVPGETIDDWFWSNAKPFTFEGVKTLQPAATQMLVQTVLHGLRANLEPSIRWVSDAAALIGQSVDPIDWSAIVAVGRKQRLACRLSMGFSYLVEQFAQPVPGWVIEQLDAAGISIIERVENLIYLGPALRMYSPHFFPLVDYWRYRRVLNARRFWREFPSYLARRWQLRHPWMIPVAAGSVLLRQTHRVRG